MGNVKLVELSVGDQPMIGVLQTLILPKYNPVFPYVVNKLGTEKRHSHNLEAPALTSLIEG